MVVIVFRMRMQPGAGAELVKSARRMQELASEASGFVSYKHFMAGDGESVAIIEFQTLEDAARFREVPEHRAVQERGRAALLTEYRMQVCELVRELSSPPR